MHYAIRHRVVCHTALEILAFLLDAIELWRLCQNCDTKKCCDSEMKVGEFDVLFVNFNALRMIFMIWSQSFCLNHIIKFGSKSNVKHKSSVG